MTVILICDNKFFIVQKDDKEKRVEISSKEGESLIKEIRKTADK